MFRRDINLQLTKGEQVHDLRQFLHFANEGKIRSHLEEEQINEASCLNLVVNAIILWNTVYMQEIVKQLRKDGYHINDDDLKHLGPARHEHINPYGPSTNVAVTDRHIYVKGVDRYRKPD